MAELPYMPIIVNDEIAEASELTNEELGALTRIKWALWKAGGYLPADMIKLARIARAGSRWGKVAPAVLALLTLAGDKVSCPSVLTTLLITRERRAQKARAGRAKWEKAEHGLTSSKPLKTQEAGGACASVLLKQLKSESKNIASRASRTGIAATCGTIQGQPMKQASETPGSVEDCSEGLLHVHGNASLDLDLYGSELLVSRVGLRLLQARAQIARWLVALEACGDAAIERLASVLAEVDQHNLQGSNLVNVVDSRVEEIATEAVFGRPLKFPPALASKRSGAA